MENTRNKPTPRRLPLAVYLAFLLAVVLAFTGTTAASFKTQASAGDGARVARFAVETVIKDGQADQYVLNTASSSSSMQYMFSVSNNSEVAASYSLCVSFGSALPAKLELSIDGIAGTTTDNQKFIFSNADWLLSPSETAEHTLNIYAPAGAVSSTKNVTGITITADVVQVN